MTLTRGSIWLSWCSFWRWCSEIFYCNPSYHSITEHIIWHHIRWYNGISYHHELSQFPCLTDDSPLIEVGLVRSQLRSLFNAKVRVKPHVVQNKFLGVERSWCHWGQKMGTWCKILEHGCVILIHVVCKCLMIRLDSQLMHVLRGTDLFLFEAMAIWGFQSTTAVGHQWRKLCFGWMEFCCLSFQRLNA